MKSVIFGIAGTTLSQEEKDFFAEHQPMGFILFKRNIDTPEQVKELVSSLKDSVDHDYVPVLIDQEGGRVRRLKPPHFREAKSAKTFANIAENDLDLAKQMTFLNHYLMGKELMDLGINTNCAPVADLLFHDAHEIISDRSFGKTPEQVIELAGAAALGLMSAGVNPIIKHIPGHGRAMVDSHEDLPIVTTSTEELRHSDFLPFKALNGIPMAMTAHIIFNDIDEEAPVTLSQKGVDFIRKKIGFPNLLITDDLSMKALSGDYSERTIKAQEAGCNIMLHCNGKMEEMTPIAEATKPAEPWILEFLESQICPTLPKEYEKILVMTDDDLNKTLDEQQAA